MRVAYYVIYDPDTRIQKMPLTIYQLQGWDYIETTEVWFSAAGLGLTTWDGESEDRIATWLRRTDGDGNLIPADLERADEERVRADEELARAERLAAQLRAAGIEPE